MVARPRQGQPPAPGVAVSAPASVSTGASSVKVERAYLDTFDWRLFRRGDALVEEQPDGGQRVLVLQSRAGERAELRVPSTGRPRQPTELPMGLQRRLGPKLAPRTLLDVGRERVEVWPLKLLDEDDKTVAYVDVERAPARCASACGRCGATRRRPTGSSRC